MTRIACLFACFLAACSAETPPAAPDAGGPSTAPPPTASSIDLKALETAHDWQRDNGDQLNRSWGAGVKAVLSAMTRRDAIAAIEAAGFACVYGEAHQDYPDPMAVCSRSFATRACQMDWEISSTADKGMVNAADGSFRRDCVGTDYDWPDKMESAIDDQVAPATPPQ